MGRPSTAEWHAYLRHFHHDRPGITEAVLSRARGHGQTPYEWLIDGLDHGDRVVDLACGSGPTRHLTGPAWIGLDASHDELAARGPPAQRAVAQGDLTELPVRSGACDTAVCSMALMLVDPLAAAVAEIRRIVRPGGTLRLLLPARRPLTPVDLARYASLAAALGTTTWFPPSRLGRNPGRFLQRAGLTVTADDRRRFSYPLHTADDAALLVDSLYLPGVGPPRRQAARRIAVGWTGTDIGLPLHRILAQV